MLAACHPAVRVACGTIGGGIGEAAFLRRPTREIGAMIDRVHGALLLPKCAATRNLGAVAAIYTRSRANRQRRPWGKMSTGVLPPAAVGEPVCARRRTRPPSHFRDASRQRSTKSEERRVGKEG